MVNDWQTEILGNYATETPADSGIYVDNADHYLKGFIDEVRIWADSSDGRVGLRLEKQIMNFMNRALPVVGLQVEDVQNHAMAYYRFDDGGTNAQDFSYSYADEVATGWPHSLKSPGLVGLSDRMLAGWDTAGAEDTSEHPVLSGVMHGGGYSEYDPLFDGWQQLYQGPTRRLATSLTKWPMVRTYPARSMNRKFADLSIENHYPIDRSPARHQTALHGDQGLLSCND